METELEHSDLSISRHGKGYFYYGLFIRSVFFASIPLACFGSDPI